MTSSRKDPMVFPPSHFIMHKEDQLHGIHVDIKINKYLSPVVVNISHFFSLDEDELLLTQKDHAPYPPYEYILREYITQHKLNQKKYPKGNLTTVIIREHLEELESNHLRSAVLRYRINRKKALSTSSGTSSTLNTPRKRKRRGRKKDLRVTYSSSTPPRSPRSSPGTPRSPREEEEEKNMVSVILPDDKDQHRTVLANPTLLSKESKYFKNLFVHVFVSTVTFQDLFQKYKGYRFFNESFRHEIFEQFANFCESPGIKDDYLEFYCRINKKNRVQNEGKKELLKKLEEQCQKYIHRLEKQTSEEIDQGTKYLEECCRRDVELIQSLYKSHIFSIRSEIEKVKERRKRELKKHMEKEKKRLEIYYDEYSASEKSELEATKADLENRIQNIVPPKTLLKMLLLSEVLQSDNLKHLCLDIISLNHHTFLSQKELGNEIFNPSTYKMMVSKFDSETLYKLKSNEISYSFPTSYVENEWMIREKSRINEYRNMATNNLKELEKTEKEYFIELLREEISKRDLHIPIVNFDTRTKSRNLLVDPKELVVELPLKTRKQLKKQQFSFKYSSIRANHPKKWNDPIFGVTYFEVDIISLGDIVMNSPVICVGWDVERNQSYSSLGGKIIVGKDPNEGGAYGYSLQNDGIFYYNGSSKILLDMEYKAGDVLGFSIEQFHDSQKRDILRFYRNGKVMDISKNLNFISIRDKNYVLFPSVTLFPHSNLLLLAEDGGNMMLGASSSSLTSSSSSSSSSTIKKIMSEKKGGNGVSNSMIIRFNFAGKFRFPLGFGQPYSEKDSRFSKNVDDGTSLIRKGGIGGDGSISSIGKKGGGGGKNSLFGGILKNKSKNVKFRSTGGGGTAGGGKKGSGRGFRRTRMLRVNKK